MLRDQKFERDHNQFTLLNTALYKIEKVTHPYCTVYINKFKNNSVNIQTTCKENQLDHSTSVGSHAKCSAPPGTSSESAISRSSCSSDSSKSKSSRFSAMCCTSRLFGSTTSPCCKANLSRT